MTWNEVLLLLAIVIPGLYLTLRGLHAVLLWMQTDEVEPVPGAVEEEPRD
jgi:hypothetical protein